MGWGGDGNAGPETAAVVVGVVRPADSRFGNRTVLSIDGTGCVARFRPRAIGWVEAPVEDG